MLFIFTPILGEDEPNLIHIFQMGWNHQLDTDDAVKNMAPYYSNPPLPWGVEPIDPFTVHETV